MALGCRDDTLTEVNSRRKGAVSPYTLQSIITGAKAGTQGRTQRRHRGEMLLSGLLSWLLSTAYPHLPGKGITHRVLDPPTSSAKRPHRHTPDQSDLVRAPVGHPSRRCWACAKQTAENMTSRNIITEEVHTLKPCFSSTISYCWVPSRFHEAMN